MKTSQEYETNAAIHLKYFAQIAEDLLRSTFGDNSGIILSIKTNVVGTHLKCLAEVLLMRTHNIYFYREIRKNIPQFSPNIPS